MRSILGLILIAVFAYLGAAMFRIARMPVLLKSLISSGLGFFAIGLLLGPQAAGLFDQQALSGLDVLVNLGIGWVGLLFGLQFYWTDLKKISGPCFEVAAVESLTTMLLVGAGISALPFFISGQPDWLPPLLLAAIASTSSPTIAAQVALDTRGCGTLTRMVRVVTSIDALPAVMVTGAAMCFSSLHPAGAGLLSGGWMWLGATFLFGLALGTLFHLMTLFRYSDNQLLVVVLGLVVFSGGVAHFLALSPLLINMLVGIVVANRSPLRSRVLGSLLRLEKPVYLILLTMAGAVWSLPPLSLLALVPPFIILRFGGKLLGGALAGRRAAPGSGPLGIGPGLLPHGGMALAIALSVAQFFPGPLGNLVLTAAIGSVFAASLISPWTMQRLLASERSRS